MKKSSLVDHLAYFLVFIGALNWGLIAIFGGFNLVVAIFHAVPLLVNCIYILIAFSAIYCMIKYYRDHSK
jgi:uncharacterized membrane protein YuzA (DUF378 family)